MVKEIKMKQTEIGFLPEDWEVKKLVEIAELINGRAYSQVELLLRGKYKVLRVGNFFSSDKWYWSDLELANKFYVEKGDLMYAWSASFGPKFWYNEKTVYHYHIWKVEVFKCLSKHFLYYLLIQDKEAILNQSQGGTMFHITKEAMGKRKFPLPPLPEQEAIAEALSDADAWIESLEQLIAKKCLIKQGAMHELLTPKEDWTVKKLGEVGKIYGGLSGKTKQDFGSGNSYYIPFMNVMKNVFTDKNFIEKVNLKQGETQNRVLKNDLLFNGSSETPEELGISSVLLEDIDNLYLNSFCFGFRIFDENVSPIFLSYIMRSPYGREVIFYLAQGATRYNLSKANFFNLEIAFPKSLYEQTRIATILSDMDAELEGLRSQLAKARQVKQGMMQELLTGRVRLV